MRRAGEPLGRAKLRLGLQPDTPSFTVPGREARNNHDPKITYRGVEYGPIQESSPDTVRKDC